MNFGEAIKTCLSKYATFSGRASRSEYWWFVLFTMLMGLAMHLLNETLGSLMSLAVLLPLLAVGTRRLHDIGRSGWWQLLWLVPLLGWIPLVYWAVQPSGSNNEHGYNGNPDEQVTMMPPPGAV